MTNVIDLNRRTQMTAKITLGALSNPSFTSTMQELLGKKLPVKTAFKIKTLVDKFNAELAKFSSLRKDLLERNCDKNESGSPLVDENGNYKFSQEALQVVSKDLIDLASIEVEFEPLSLDSLGDIDVTAQQLFDLGPVVQA